MSNNLLRNSGNIDKDKLCQEVAGRISLIIKRDFESTPLRFSEKLGARPSVVKPWVDGHSLPGGYWLTKIAALGYSVDWLLTGKETEDQVTAADPGEVARLREETASAQKRIRTLTEQLEGMAGVNRQQLDETDAVKAERDRLLAETKGLRVQAANQVLSHEEARLVKEVANALRVPAERGLLGVLEQVRANLASVGALSPPTEHEPDIETKGEGGQGGTTKKRRRGTSST